MAALRAWYREVRPLFAVGGLHRELVSGLQHNLDLCLKERIKRLIALEEKLEWSKQMIQATAKEKNTEAVSHHDRVLAALEKAPEIFNQVFAERASGPGGEAVVRDVEVGIR